MKDKEVNKIVKKEIRAISKEIKIACENLSKQVLEHVRELESPYLKDLLILQNVLRKVRNFRADIK